MKIKTIYLMISIFFSPILFASTTCPLLTGININSKERILNICKQGNVIKTFKIAIGYKGVGKKQRGDYKTPIGLYGLAYPRKSNQYKVFIPILYPSAKQSEAGYTGGDVGIHGPSQTSLSWLNNLPSATRGCIAVGKNHYIEYVANWVKAHPGAKVLII